MKVEATHRGFPFIGFVDRYGVKCSLQKSSLASEDAIWFGVDDADPKILASKTEAGGTGWVKYPLPDDVSLNTRMHLTREQVAELLPHLQAFVDTGEIQLAEGGERREIIINGRKESCDKCLCYDEIVALAGKSPDTSPTVTWRYKGDAGGTLTKGEYIMVEHGLIVNVADTGNA